MNTKENLYDTQAIAKLKELAVAIGTCMFCTDIDTDRTSVRPMATTNVDEEGNLWFFTSGYSDKIPELYHDKNVQLIYAHPGKESYMNILGQATIVKDRRKIDELWNAWAKAWFPEGKDDPKVTLIKVTPDEAYYWDTQDGKMMLFLKMLASAVTGKILTDSVRGELKV
jgi:general stress protein 26